MDINNNDFRKTTISDREAMNIAYNLRRIEEFKGSSNSNSTPKSSNDEVVEIPLLGYLIGIPILLGIGLLIAKIFPWLV